MFLFASITLQAVSFLLMEAICFLSVFPLLKGQEFGMEDIYLVCIWGLAGFVNGISGMGAALMAVPFMTLFMDIRLIVPFSCLMVVVLSSTLAIKYRSEFHIKIILPALFCAIPGAFLGTLVLKILSSHVLEIFMAVVLIVYAIWNFMQKYTPKEERNSALVGGACGFFSGFFGSTISFTGPPLAIYILYTGWKQQKALGSLGAALIIITGTSCVSHYFAGLYTKEFLHYLLIGVPAGFFGMLVSFPFIKYITQETFRKILLLVIGFAGIMCLTRVIHYYF